MEPASTRTTCPYCGVGCGVTATLQPDGAVTIAGDPDHPANYGRLCSKGTALGETLSLDDRLLFPEMSGRRTGWDVALDHIAARLSETIQQHGPDSVALYVSGQILTEDYYVANKFMKGFVGSANIDTNSRLCMASSVAGHRRAFGTDTVPGTYTDLETADLVVLVGSNLAWCHPVLFQRLLAAREQRGTQIVVIDPRRTVTAEAADLHLALAPDSDLPLFLGLLRELQAKGQENIGYLTQYCSDPASALAAAGPFDLTLVAAETGLPVDAISRFFALFVQTERVVTVYSQGVNQSVTGADKVNAIINCHLFTGRIGREGMGPFSITGQPNAMGGREVGGLANMLAAHMNIEDPTARDRVRRFWNSPTIAQRPGLKAVDLFRAVGEGSVKAIWIMGTNPVDSLPDADRVRAALKACPFVVVSEVVRKNDTTPFAHVLLPAEAWGEKSGTVTNSERRISRQRRFLPAPEATRPDWWALSQVAMRMGFAGFDYPDAAAVYREHASLSAFENEDTRDFDLGAHTELNSADYDKLEPFQWPLRAGETTGQPRFFEKGGFYTQDRRAQLVPTPPRGPVKTLGPERPLWLNTGRIRDQWHTMTRTGKAARLLGHVGEPFCEIHPQDATELNILPASLVEVETDFGTAILRALISDRQRPGSIFAPMHWSDRFASRGRVNATTHPACDPVSGQPGLKATPAQLRPFEAKWYGFAVSRQPMRPVSQDYWALAPAEGGYRAELAGRVCPEDWQAFARALLDAPEGAEWIVYLDTKAGLARYAAFYGGRLLGALFAGPHPIGLSRGFVSAALTATHDSAARFRLLAGRGGADSLDPGPTICACFAVGLNQIIAAVGAGAASVEDVGEALKAGTNCGSCRGEIRRITDEARFQKAG
ncbi:BisC Anaerobic dehydrogenases, typically selenocysteine-containing [Rhabdaerophilaceae bacterium]